MAHRARELQALWGDGQSGPLHLMRRSSSDGRRVGGATRESVPVRARDADCSPSGDASGLGSLTGTDGTGILLRRTYCGAAAGWREAHNFLGVRPGAVAHRVFVEVLVGLLENTKVADVTPFKWSKK